MNMTDTRSALQIRRALLKHHPDLALGREPRTVAEIQSEIRQGQKENVAAMTEQHRPDIRKRWTLADWEKTAGECIVERDRLRADKAELRAALESLLVKVDCGYHRDVPDMVSTREQARAAIAKAKGE